MADYNLHRRSPRCRLRGIATLEFAMALPVLLLLMIGITWLAFSMIGQAEVLVQARNDAWRQRFEDLAKQPLMFPSGIGDLRNPLYSTERDYVAKTVRKTVNVSQVFSGIPGPSASVTVLAGSWDHRAMNLNEPPNFSLYLRAAGNAVTKNVQTQLSQLSSLITSVENMGAAGILQAISNADSAASDAANSKSQGSSGSSQAEAEKAQKKQDIIDQQKKLGGFIDPNPLGDRGVLPTSGGQLDKTNDEITKLEFELDAKRRQQPLKDEEQEKKRLAEIAKTERRLQLLKDKKQRIEAEIRDNDEELKGFD